MRTMLKSPSKTVHVWLYDWTILIEEVLIASYLLSVQFSSPVFEWFRSLVKVSNHTMVVWYANW